MDEERAADDRVSSGSGTPPSKTAGGTATPAAADSSACTHHLSGPQVCIRLDGRNGRNNVTGFWANPPRSARSRAITLHLDGKHFQTGRGHRRGRTISYTWPGLQTGTEATLCIGVRGTDRRACQHTKRIGDRTT